ncbi:beta-aspartyl-peptidase [Candidatus Merdisoma sp. JLR.KK006]|uniref:beta-aspartyl-peptidase n=1 Tax=Candidatus Merdisoma sp. JLR.KK006 TaxID=3112626 RepID=UPI002FEED023
MLKLIKNAAVYAPEYLGIQDILIGDSRILKLASDIPAVDAYDVEVLDGTGKLLFPGFIDGHVHILGGGGEGSYHTRTPEIMLTDITSGGVTTVVGCLGTDGTTRNMASLLAKARGLSEEGISAYVYTGSYQVPVRTLTGSIVDDLILIDKVVGCGEIAISDHRSSQPTREEFAHIVGDTRVGGILSGKAGLVNIHMGDGSRMLSYLRYVIEETEIPSSNMLPTHINRSTRLLNDGIDYAKSLGGFVDLTTSSDPDYLEEDEVKASIGLRLMLEQGVPENQITFSSDGQGSMPIFAKDGTFLGLGVGKVTSLYREVRDAILQEKVNITQALRPVTANPAALLKLENKGRIAVGKDADLVLVNESSLTIDTVIAKGQLMVQGGAAIKKGTFE